MVSAPLRSSSTPQTPSPSSVVLVRQLSCHNEAFNRRLLPFRLAVEQCVCFAVLYCYSLCHLAFQGLCKRSQDLEAEDILNLERSCFWMIFM